MFGRVDEIRREFPGIPPDLSGVRGTGADGELFSDLRREGWSGNVFDFYFIVYDRIARGLRLPGAEAGWDADGKKDVAGKADTGDKTEADEDPAVCQALREALANCLTNAD